MAHTIKETLDRWNEYLDEQKKEYSAPLSEAAQDAYDQMKEKIQQDIARLTVQIEKIDVTISKERAKKEKIKKAQVSLRLKKKNLASRYGIQEDELSSNDGCIGGIRCPPVIDEDVPACGKPGNPSKGSDGKFSSYSDRASQSRFYSCGDDRESKAGSKSSTCGRSDPKRKEKCKD